MCDENDYLLLYFGSSICVWRNGLCYCFEEAANHHYHIYRSCPKEWKGHESIAFFWHWDRKITTFWRYNRISRGICLDLAHFFYAQPENIVISLDTLKWSNTFLLNSYYGDGCAASYQVLSFRPDDTYYMSDEFGNCNEIFRIDYQYPIMTFMFDELEEYRPKAVYSYDGRRYTLVQIK